MANLKISLRKKGASSFEGGDKLLPETDWGFILNKPATFVPDPHGHAISEITGLQAALNGQTTQAWVTANTRSNTWVPSWDQVTGLLDQLDGKAGESHTHQWNTIGGKPTFAPVATSGNYNDLSNKPTIPSIPSVMDQTEGNSGTDTTQRTINALNLKSIILNHSPAGSRPASDVYSWAKSSTKPTYDLDQISDGTTYKRVTESERNAWNAKQTAAQVEALIGSYNSDLVTPSLASKLSNSLKGSANGLAELGSDGKVPPTQLPSYVDDVLEYAAFASFPTTGESGKIYIDLTTNKTYRWGGSGYVVISETLALGTTSSTAYRGDLGKIAYDHSQVAHAPSNAQKNSDITKTEIEAKLTGPITSHTHAYLADNHPAAGVTTDKINNWDTAYVDTNNATHVGTSNRIVKRDASGNFAAGTITANLAGTASGNLTSESALNPAKVSQTTSYRFVTDSEKNAWNAKQTAAQVEALIGSYNSDLVTPSLASKLSNSLKGSANGLAELGSDGKVPPTQLPSYVNPVYTHIFTKDTLGSFSVPNHTKYSMYMVNTSLVMSNSDVQSYQSGFISNNGKRFSVQGYDQVNQANAYITARVSGGTLTIDDMGQMPWSAVGGSKAFNVELWGVEFKL